MTKIKICGNTWPADVTLAIELGVDLLGFIFTRSKRQITIEQGEALVRDLPAHVERVGVFIEEPTSLIGQTVEACSLSAVQIYRRVTPEDRGLGVRMVPAFRIGNGQALDDVRVEHGDRLLLDTWSPESDGGGSGQSWNWKEAKPLAARAPIIVSGGLTPQNVGDAVRRLRPWGVDVCSGVEAEPGRKDAVKLRAFVDAVRSFDCE